MSWFILALIATLSWGFADLFYKKGTDESDKYSHLKITVWVGMVMFVTSIILLLFSGEKFTAKELLFEAIEYLPASAGYILSMVIGYAGMRYLEISIISPVQNASGALSAAAMIAFFLFKGKITSIKESYSAIDIIGTVFIVSVVLSRLVLKERLQISQYILIITVILGIVLLGISEGLAEA